VVVRVRKKQRGMTVGQWLDVWLATYIEPRLRDGELAGITVAGYRGHVRRYLKPALGEIELRRLRPEDVTALYQKMGAPKADGGYGLSVRTPRAHTRDAQDGAGARGGARASGA